MNLKRKVYEPRNLFKQCEIDCTYKGYNIDNKLIVDLTKY